MIKIIKKTILIISILLPLSLIGKNLDSLINKALILEQEPYDSSLAVAYYNIVKHTYRNDLDTAIHFLNKSILVSRELEYKSGLQKAATTLSSIYSKQGKYDKAFKYVKICINETPNESNYQSCLRLAGDIKRKKLAFDKAKYYYNQADSIGSIKQDTAFLAVLYHQMGLLYDLTEEYDKSIDLYLKSSKLEEHLGDKYGSALSLANVAGIYSSLKEPKKVFQYVKLARTVVGITDDRLEKLLLEKEAIAHKINLDYDRSISLYKQSYELAKKEPDLYSMAASLYNISSIEYKRENFSGAKKYLNEGLKYVKNNTQFFSYYNILSVIEYDLGNCIEAYQWLEKTEKYLPFVQDFEAFYSFYGIKSKILFCNGNYIEGKTSLDSTFVYADSFYFQRKEVEAKKIESKYQLERKEKENILLRQEKDLQKARADRNILMIGGLFILLSLVGFWGYRRQLYAKKLKAYYSLLETKNTEIEKNNLILKEKNEKIELLHEELSHRVKNNLAVVSSLMKMQGRRAKNDETKNAIKEGQMRIEAMSLIHRKLYIGNDHFINMGDYIGELCDKLSQTFPSIGQKPLINIQAENAYIEAETAVYIGLIINELVTNSFKYAFKNHKKPLIDISFSPLNSTDQYRLTYRDNGVGMPVQMDLSSSETLGLKLINTISNQLKGSMNFKNESGLCFELEFNDKKI